MACKFPLLRNRITGRIIGYKQYNDPTHPTIGIKLAWDKTSNITAPKIKKIYTNHHVTYKDLTTKPEWQLIPCGQCTECRLDYSRKWAARCMCESMTSTQSWFLTLTYDPAHVPTINKDSGLLYRGGTYEVHDGKLEQVLTLNPDDFTRFKETLNKKLRRAGKKPIRYYMCGEYGSTTYRPHYHMIAFGLELQPDEMEFMFVNKEHQPIYKCQWLEDLWGKGIVRIGAVTWNSCAYVARYIMKKQNGKEGERRKEIIGNIPEYTRSSKRPGIGAEYALMNQEKIEEIDKIILPGKKARTLHTPEYFERLYDQEFEKNCGTRALNDRKIKRSAEKFGLKQRQIKNKKKKSTLDWWEQLRVEHEAKADKYKKLIRPLE